MSYDFSKWESNCHYLGDLMTPAKGKSYKEKYDDAQKSFDEKFDRAEATVNKKTDTYAKLVAAANKQADLMEKYEPLIHLPNLSETCKSRLNQVYTEVTEGIKKEVKSKYLKKGLMVEEDSITLYSQFTGEFHKKNTERKNNGTLTGECDIKKEMEDGRRKVIDTKSNWDIFSFDATRFKPIKPLYSWQIDGYIWLFNADIGELAYCLTNTPEHLIKAEERMLMYEMFGSELAFSMADTYMLQVYGEGCANIRKRHIHDGRDVRRRVKTFIVNRSEERIEAIKSKIPECRWYLNNIENLNEIEDDTES